MARGDQRLVVKVGSSTLTCEDGGLDLGYIDDLARQIGAVRDAGVQVILVSSGAIAAGLSRLDIVERPCDMPSLQAAASVGSVALAQAYAAAFANVGIPIGQVLLTRNDTTHRESYLHARDTFERLLELGVVPVVNENDTVAVEEIRFGDNDTLAALVGSMTGADLVILLSDIDGFYDTDPRDNDEAHLLEEVEELTAEMICAAGGAGTASGTGGMATKVEAARVLMQAGIPMVICEGHRPDALLDAVEGKLVGTTFRGGGRSVAARKLWIALGHRPKGEVFVDQGAVDALRGHGTSLLPVGVTRVEGSFEKGDAIVLRSPRGLIVGRGLTGYSSDEIDRVKGMRIDDVGAVFPHLAGKPVVHRDQLVVL